MYIASYKGRYHKLREEISSSSPEDAAITLAKKMYELRQPTLVTGLFQGIRVRSVRSKKKAQCYSVGICSSGAKILPNRTL